MTFSATITSTHVETGIRIDASLLASTTTQLAVFLTTEYDSSHIDTSDVDPLDGQLIKSTPKHGNLIYSMPLPLNGTSSSMIIPSADLIEGIDYTVALEVTGTVADDEGIVQLENVRYVAPPAITDEAFTVQVGDQAIFIGISNENEAIEGFKIYINGKFAEAPTKHAYKTVTKLVTEETGRNIVANGALGRIDGIGLVNANTYEVSYRKFIISNGTKIYSIMSATLAGTPQSVAANPAQTLGVVVGKFLLEQGYVAEGNPTDQTFVSTFEEGVPAENYPFTSYIFQIDSGSNAPFFAVKNVDTDNGGSFLSSTDADPDVKYVLFNQTAFTYYDSFNAITGDVTGNVVDFNSVVVDGVTTTYTIYSRNGSGTSEGALSGQFVTSGIPVQMNAPTTLTGEANVPSQDMSSKVRVIITPPDANGSTITAYKFKISGGNIVVPTYITKLIADFTIDGSNRYIDLTQASDDGTLVTLDNGLSYTITVTAVSANGESIESTNSSAFIPSTKPSAPTGLVGSPIKDTISVLNSGELKLEWNVVGNQVLTNTVTNGSAILNYYVKVIQVGTGQVGVDSVVSPSVVEIVKTGLTNGLEYELKIFARNANGDSPLAAATGTFVPSKKPSFSSNAATTTTFLTAAIRNTFIGLIDGNIQSFSLNLSGIEALLDDGGYAITSVDINVTSAVGQDNQSISIVSGDFDVTQSFENTNKLVITNGDHIYNLDAYPLNAVYNTTVDSTPSGISGIHVTTNILNIVSGPNPDPPTGQVLDYNWTLDDYDANDQFTEGVSFNLQLFVSKPTLQPDGYTIAYGAYEVANTSSITIVSGTTNYTKQYTGLEYGWRYQLYIEVLSQQYGAGTNPNLPAVASPTLSSSIVSVPNEKPVIAVNEGTGVLTVTANGTSISEVLVLSTVEDRTAVESYLSSLRSVTTASEGNIGVAAGLPEFNFYMNGATKTAYVSEVSITNLGVDNAHLTIVENNKGVTLELNGTPLGLSSA